MSGNAAPAPAGSSSGSPPLLFEQSGATARWAGRERFVILEAGFASPMNFLAAWRAWRNDRRACRHLHFIAIGTQWPTRSALQALPGAPQPLLDQLVATWPPPTPNLHRLSFEDGRVQLLLGFGRLTDWLPEIVAAVDVFLLDEDASGCAATTGSRLAKAFGRLAAPAAMLVSRGLKAELRAGLQSGGFCVDELPGTRDTTTTAHFAPSFMPRQAAARRPRPRAHERHAVIVGAGLAGCAAAWALAEHGWHSTLLERQAAPAREGSGNPAGLFHGIVNGQDGIHARFNRAAALEAHRVVRVALERHGVAGSARGLLRLETGGATLASMRATLCHLGLPAAYVEALDARSASTLAGLPLHVPAWFYPGGGWVEPAGLARAFLRCAGAAATLRTGIEVARLQRRAAAWQLLDAGGNLIAASNTIVLANSGDALRLLGAPDWPLRSVRGQISRLPLACAPALQLPRVPITGSGYLLPEVDGMAIWGATAQRDDPDPAVRASDHDQNIARLSMLFGVALSFDPTALTGRTAWRCVSDDRLPVIGAVPAWQQAECQWAEWQGDEPQAPKGPIPDASKPRSAVRQPRLDQPRHVPRLPGLFVFSALGSRGITWSALGAQVLAAAVSGAPAPIEASLLDGVDPARFVARRNRRTARPAPV